MEKWRDLPQDVRIDVIRRGDRGVFSVDVIRDIAHSENVWHQFMRVSEIEKIGKMHYTVNGVDCQMVILALGFDPLWFLTLFEKEDKPKFPAEIEASISHDLSIKFTEPNMPKIYVPMLAGIEQGPGFPNLSCLGTLSDRILNRISAPAV